MPAKTRSLLVIVSLYFSLYALSIWAEQQLLTALLAPIGGLLCFVILLGAFFRSPKQGRIRYAWLLLSFAGLCWLLGDLLWLLDEQVLQQNAAGNTFIALLYLGTNVFLLAALAVYGMDNFGKWSKIQLILDAAIVTITTLLLTWHIFFKESYELFDQFGGSGLVTILTIFLDFVLSIGAAVWFVSYRDNKPALPIRITAFGVMLYLITDICWIYLDLNRLYMPDGLVDAAYMAALLIIAFSAAVHLQDPEELQYGEAYSAKRNFWSKIVYICIAPLMTLFFRGFDLFVLINFLLLGLFYISASAYIQVSIKNEKILRDQNRELALRIRERTQELEEKNRQLDYLSNHDTVTNLFNRRYFLRTLEEILQSIAPNETLALLFIDLDRFKTINDTYGHSIGDRVLVELSKRLQALIGEKQTLARFGGDEFILAVHSGSAYAEIESIAGKIIRECSRAIRIDQYTFYLTVSIGISIFPLDAKNVDTLLKNADMAMYQAKKQGCNEYVTFSRQLQDLVQRKNEIEMLLKHADYEHEMTLYFQPQFTLREKKLIGMEALLRWNSPQKGCLEPAEFIPIAEETNDIIPLGGWVLKKAMQRIAVWNETFALDLKMSVNVSPKQLNQIDFIERLQALLTDCAIRPAWLDLEITENVAWEGRFPFSKTAGQLKQLGVNISIDDFGTGYSSLSSLKLFPIDKIKIAKPLIDAVSRENLGQSIAKYTIQLANAMGIKTIAEGVETKEQMELLLELGCEQVQGYYLGKPLPAEQFEQAFLIAGLRQNNTDP
ncbi:MAG: EAL domain-containing protein [Negativicutes bacterium]|nr:EAL domain-containing protein [Negativicutes bacterium]